MFLEWDRLEGMVVNEAINLPCQATSTALKRSVTCISRSSKSPNPDQFDHPSIVHHESLRRTSWSWATTLFPFQPAVFSVSSQASGRREHHLVVLERSWSLSRYSAQESSGPNHFRPCTSFPLRGHLLPLLLSPTRRPRCQGLHLHVHASSNVRISLLSNPRIDNLPPPGLRRWTPIGRWCPPSPTSPTSTMPWSSTSRSALFASLLSSPLRYHLYISEAFDNQNIFLQFLRRDKSRIPWAQKLELVNKIFWNWNPCFLISFIFFSARLPGLSSPWSTSRGSPPTSPSSCWSTKRTSITWRRAFMSELHSFNPLAMSQ